MRRFCEAVREADAPARRLTARARASRPRFQESPCLNYHQPDARGHFGPYGGTFVAETLIHALDELEAAYEQLPRTTPSSWPSSATS